MGDIISGMFGGGGGNIDTSGLSGMADPTLSGVPTPTLTDAGAPLDATAGIAAPAPLPTDVGSTVAGITGAPSTGGGGLFSNLFGGSAGSVAPVGATAAPTADASFGGAPVTPPSGLSASGAPTAVSPASVGAFANPLPGAGDSGIDPATGAASLTSTGGGAAAGDPSLASSVAGITGAGPAAGSGTLQSILGKGGILKDVLGTGMIGLDIARATSTSPQIKAEEALASQQGALATSQGALAQGEQQGILPTGGEEFIQNQLNANIASIRNKYAGMGMSGSTAERQEIAAAQQQALSERFQIGNTLATTSLNAAAQATGLDAKLLQEIYAADEETQQQLAQALGQIAGFSTDAGRPSAPVAAAG